VGKFDLVLGDCLDHMATMPDDTIPLTVTSPPYDDLREYGGVLEAKPLDWRRVISELYRVTRPGGVVVWVVGDATKNGSESGTSFRQALHALDCGFNLETMIYKALGTGAKGSNYYYWQCFEYMFVFSKGQPKTSNRIADVENKNFGAAGYSRAKVDGTMKNEPSHCVKEFGVRPNVWEYSVGFANNSDRTGHPAPFPEALARDHILSWSNEGDLVYDPFTGSGTTGKMAILTGREFLGTELNADYYQIAHNRISEAVIMRQNSQGIYSPTKKERESGAQMLPF